MNTVLNSAFAETLLYHVQTKHHFHRYARSAGFLDWANQPNPFRFYEGVTAVRLPLLQKDPASKHLALYEGSRNASQDFTRETIGGLLELSLGLSAWKSIPGSTWALRMNPSSGNLHPTEAHLILPALPGVTAGIFHYNSFLHALEPRALVPETLWQQIKEHLHTDGFLVALTSIFWREAWKYGERAFRYCRKQHARFTRRWPSLESLLHKSFAKEEARWPSMASAASPKTSFAPCWTKPFHATPARRSISD